MSDCPDCARYGAAAEAARAREQAARERQERFWCAWMAAFGLAFFASAIARAVTLNEDVVFWTWASTLAIIAPLAWWRRWGVLGAR